MNELEPYISAFTRLKRGVTKYGMAPHKPILLLTLIELIDKGLVMNNRFEVNVDLVGHIKSVQTLSDTVAYGAFAPELFQLLMIENNRILAKDVILFMYFPEQRGGYYQQKQLDDGFYHDMQVLVLNDPEVRYKHVSIQTEEDIFIRSDLFKRYISQFYQNTCAMAGMRMRSTFKYNFIDACHIVPFAAYSGYADPVPGILTP